MYIGDYSNMLYLFHTAVFREHCYTKDTYGIKMQYIGSKW